MKTARPNLLLLVHRFPFPPNRGDRIRSFHLLEHLARGANVYLATLADEVVPAGDLQELSKRCERVGVEHLGKSRWFHAFASMANGGSATEGLFRSQSLKQVIQEWSQSVQFDAAVVFCSSMMQYIEIPELQHVPAIVDLVDVDSQKWFDYAARTTGMKRAVFRLEGGRLRKLESRICDRASAIVLVSDAEAELFCNICPNGHTHGISNGVDLEYFGSMPGEGRLGRCVFVGALDYHANIDGIRWFCRHVWPRIIAIEPSATLAIVGRNPTSEVARLGLQEGIEVFGSVPDVRPFLNDASVVIAPLRIARGIQNKVIEAMACRRAVVGSPESLVGLQVQPGVQALVATTPQKWCDAILHLFSCPSDRMKLAIAGRRYAEKHHNWNSCFRPYEDLLVQATRVPQKAPLRSEGFVSSR